MNDSNSGKILVVDDSAVMRTVITSMLRDAGLESIEADSGNAALKVAQNEKIKLLITDYNMPKMDGISLIKQIKQLPNYRFLRCLVISTEYEENFKMRAKAAGASGWMTKPINSQNLLTTVGKLGITPKMPAAH